MSTIYAVDKGDVVTKELILGQFYARIWLILYSAQPQMTSATNRSPLFLNGVNQQYAVRQATHF